MGRACCYRHVWRSSSPRARPPAHPCAISKRLTAALLGCDTRSTGQNECTNAQHARTRTNTLTCTHKQTGAPRNPCLSPPALQAAGVYAFVYLAYAIIKHQLDACYSQHLQRLHALEADEDALREGGLPWSKGGRPSAPFRMQLTRTLCAAQRRGTQLSPVLQRQLLLHRCSGGSPLQQALLQRGGCGGAEAASREGGEVREAGAADAAGRADARGGFASRLRRVQVCMYVCA